MVTNQASLPVLPKLSLEEPQDEVRRLVVLGAQPCVVRVRLDRIQPHQALDEPTE